MTFVEAFYLFILPIAITVGGFGWVLYERSRNHHHLHPGE